MFEDKKQKRKTIYKINKTGFSKLTQKLYDKNTYSEQ